MSRERLDRLLREWAAGHGVDGADARRLADRIVEELGRAPLPGTATPDAPRTTVSSHTKLLWGVLAVAAAILVVLVPVWIFRPSSPPEDATPPGPQIAVSESEIQANARLFAEVRRLFGNDLRWVSETGGQVQLGVQPVAGRPIPGSPSLWIRVLVVERRVGQSSWQTVLKSDVLTRNEEYVQSQPDPRRDNRLTLWGYVLPDGNVAVDSRIRLTEPIRLSADVTNVFTPGKPVQVFSLSTDRGETRVFQVVILLPPGEDRSWSDA